MQIGVQAHFNGIAWSSEFRTVVQRLVLSMFDLINLTNHQNRILDEIWSNPAVKFDQFDQAGGEFDQSQLGRIFWDLGFP